MAEKELDIAATDFLWNIFETNSQLESIQRSWASLLGITEPQWLILTAVSQLDTGVGVAGVEISKKLRVHATFISNQTKSLEQRGFLSRRASESDTRLVLMSLTSKAIRELAKLSKRKLALNTTMFDGLEEKALADLNTALAKIAQNAQLAARLLAIDVS